MRRFLRRSRRLLRADTYDAIPRPKPNELLVIPISNTLWHPSIAVFANNGKSPEWYRKVATGNAGLRRCYAVADYVRLGYTIPMWANIDIRPPLDASHKQWDVRFNIDSQHPFQAEVLDEHSAQKYLSDASLKFNQFHFEQSGECPVTSVRGRPQSHYVKLVNPWLFVTAPGYSTLFIPPIWEPNSNYNALAGVVNTDYYHHCNVVLNILATEQFSIHEGAPLLHAIPFKRDLAIKKSIVVRGHDEMFGLLDDLGFGAVHKPLDWHGEYKRTQAKLERQEASDV